MRAAIEPEPTAHQTRDLEPIPTQLVRQLVGHKT
jgi:hypothetical protein